MLEGIQPLWYRAMLTMCPYLAEPVVNHVEFDDYDRFEIAKRKTDGASVLWCEKNRGSFCIHLEEQRFLFLCKDDLMFQSRADVPPEPLYHTCLDWAEIHKESGIRSMDYLFHNMSSIRFVTQVHRNLFVACISASPMKETGEFERKDDKTLVFYTATNRVLYTLSVYVEILPETPDYHPEAFVSFDRARMCIRTGMYQVTYYGPKNFSRINYTHKPDSAVILRQVLCGKRACSDIAQLVKPGWYDKVTGWSLLRCALESRNHEVCKEIARIAKNELGLISFFIFLGDNKSMLYTAVKTQSVPVVQLLIENGAIPSIYKIQRDGYSIVSRSLNHPELADLVLDQQKICEFDDRCIAYFSVAGVTLCEPVLQILKKKGSKIFTSDALRLNLIMAIMSKHMPDGIDPGLLVMNARFLRSLILEGPEISEEDQKRLLRRCMRFKELYMLTFLAYLFPTKPDANDCVCMNFIREPTRSETYLVLEQIYMCQLARPEDE
jgi:hypothetical protein